MATLQIRDPYGNTFTIDASARAFWETPKRVREGYTILSGEESSGPPEGPVQSQQDGADTPKTTTRRAARAAQDVKEQPDE